MRGRVPLKMEVVVLPGNDLVDLLAKIRLYIRIRVLIDRDRRCRMRDKDHADPRNDARMSYNLLHLARDINHLRMTACANIKPVKTGFQIHK